MLVLEAQQYGQSRVSGLIEKPLSSNGRNNGLQAHKVNKWVLRKANESKGAQREKYKLMGIMRCRKVRMGHNRPEVMK